MAEEKEKDKKLADAEPNPAPPVPPAPAPVPTNEQYAAKVVRYIPGALVASYTTMLGLISEDPTHIFYLSWAVFAVCLVMTPLYVIFIPDSIPENKECSKRFHVLASVIAFCAWAFAIGGPFAQLAFYRPLYGALVLIVTTLAIPLLEKVLMKFEFFRLKP